jgi:hypothetical protein
MGVMNMRNSPVLHLDRNKIKEQVVARKDMSVLNMRNYPTLHLDRNKNKGTVLLLLFYISYSRRILKKGSYGVINRKTNY